MFGCNQALLSTHLKDVQNLGATRLSFFWSLCYPCFSVARLFLLYYILSRFNVGGQFNILKGEVNFQIQSEPYSESREQGIDNLPFLEQSRINNTYKKESRQLGVAQSEEADRQRTSRVKHKTNRRWDLLGGQMHQHPRDVPEAWLSSLNALYGLLQQSDDLKTVFGGFLLFVKPS